MCDLFRVAFVHLAAVGFDEKFWHGTGENNTRPSRLRHVVRTSGVRLIAARRIGEPIIHFPSARSLGFNRGGNGK